MLVLKSKACFSEPNSEKYVRSSSFIFLNSRLISKIILKKYYQTKAELWQRKRSVFHCFDPSTARTGRSDSFPGVIPDLCSLRILKFYQRCVSNFKPRTSDIKNVGFFHLYEPS